MSMDELELSFPDVLIRELEYQLPQFLLRQRWFGGKARTISQVKIADALPLPNHISSRLTAARNEQTGVPSAASAGTESGKGLCWLLIVEVAYTDGGCERYTLPVSLHAPKTCPLQEAAIARWSSAGKELVVCESSRLADFWLALLGLLTRQHAGPTLSQAKPTSWSVLHTNAFSLAQAGPFAPEDVVIFSGEQSQSLAILRKAVVLKLFRRLEEGLSPDWEISQFLTEQAHFPHIPAALAALAYRPATHANKESISASAEHALHNNATTTLVMMTSYRPNRGDAWICTLEELANLCDRVSSLDPAKAAILPDRGSSAWVIWELSGQWPPAPWPTLVGEHLQRIRLLGQRTAELHLALASSSLGAFVPEPIDLAWQVALSESCSAQLQSGLALLRRHLPELRQPLASIADAVLQWESRLQQCTWPLHQRLLGGLRIRIHGDYHLGQILCTEDDFVILDFEGEPGRPLVERRQKQSPLRDVAGMIRSFHYAAAMAKRTYAASHSSDQALRLSAWLRSWYVWTSSAFLGGYLQTPGITELLPARIEDCVYLLQVLLLQKAAYELTYELNHRPDWVEIPLLGLQELAGDDSLVSLSA